jgi:hypothetical protein
MENKSKIIDCDCKGHLLRLELVDWLDWDEYPGVYLSFWSPSSCVGRGYGIWFRLKQAWKYFKGDLVEDDFAICQKEKLIEFRDTLNLLISEWEAFDKEKAERKEEKHV